MSAIPPLGPVLIAPVLGLADWLRSHDVTEVDVCGIATDYCVRATALDAARAGFSVRVIEGLTAAVSPDNVPDVRRNFAAREWRRPDGRRG